MLFSEKYKRQFIKQDEQQGTFFKKGNFPVVEGETCTHTLARAHIHTHTQAQRRSRIYNTSVIMRFKINTWKITKQYKKAGGLGSGGRCCLPGARGNYWLGNDAEREKLLLRESEKFSASFLRSGREAQVSRVGYGLWSPFTNWTFRSRKDLICSKGTNYVSIAWLRPAFGFWVKMDLQYLSNCVSPLINGSLPKAVSSLPLLPTP